MDKKEELAKIEDKIKNCRKCDLWKIRTKTVPGEGSEDSKIVFIGEAPGRMEDSKGKPFVGRAGKILEELLKEVGIEREDVFITNILKCRPPNNRNPLKSEMQLCTEYLSKQIEIIDPKVIVTLGNFASSFIMEKYNLNPEKISDIHGKTINIKNLDTTIKIFPMYHPAVATYDPNKKTVLLEDLIKLKKII